MDGRPFARQFPQMVGQVVGASSRCAEERKSKVVTASRVMGASNLPFPLVQVLQLTRTQTIDGAAECDTICLQRLV